MPAEDQFLNKLGEIPIVHDGWTTAMDYYTKVKAYNSLTKFTLGAAETSLKKAAEISTPVLARYQPQIDTVNTYACNKLESMEEKYPLIRQPTEEVKEACVGYVQPAFDKVKPVVTYVNGVVENTHKKVNEIKETSNIVVNGARELGYSTVSSAVTMSLETPPGRLVTTTLDFALTQADSLIDKYIPEEEQDGDDSSEDLSNGDDSGLEDQHQGVEPMEEMAPSPARVAVQLRRVSSKLQRRLHRRAKHDFEVAKVRTMEALNQLQSTLDIRDYAKTNFTGAYSKAQDIWEKIKEDEDPNVEAEAVVTDNTYAQVLEKRIITMGRIITRQVSTGVAALEKASAEAGLFVKDPISKSREYKDLIYQFSSSNLSLGYEKARETIVYFQKKLQSMIDNLETPEWLEMDIDMEGIHMGEDDEEPEGPEADNSIEFRPWNHVGPAHA